MEMESLISCVMLQHLDIANNSLYGQLAPPTTIHPPLHISLCHYLSLSLTLSLCRSIAVPAECSRLLSAPVAHYLR